MNDEADADREFWEEPEDAWPDEPDEFDPSSLGPEVPQPPEPPDPTSDEVDVPADLVRAFWAAVLFANIGLLGVSLGPMLIVFEGRTDAGIAAFLVGVLSLLFTYRQYHGYVYGDDDEGEGDTDGTEGSEGGAAANEPGGSDGNRSTREARVEDGDGSTEGDGSRAADGSGGGD